MRIALLVLIAACSKTAAPPTCDHAITGAVERVVANTTADAKATIAKIAPIMKQVLTEACTQDKWAPGVIACIDGAKSQKELTQCDHQLTPEQRKAERVRMDKVLANALDPTVQGSGAGPGSGSATP